MLYVLSIIRGRLHAYPTSCSPPPSSQRQEDWNPSVAIFFLHIHAQLGSALSDFCIALQSRLHLRAHGTFWLLTCHQAVGAAESC